MKHNSGALQTLNFFYNNGIKISAISNTSLSNDYSQLVRMFGWNRYFRSTQFFISLHKFEHIKRHVKKKNITRKYLVVN